MAVTHTIPFLNTPRVHLVSTLLGLLAVLVLFAVLTILNVYKLDDDQVVVDERANISSLSNEVTDVYQQFVNTRRHLGDQYYLAVEPSIRKLKERYQFCTSFLRAPSSDPGMNAQIEERMRHLKASISSISSSSKEDLPNLVIDIDESQTNAANDGAARAPARKGLTFKYEHRYRSFNVPAVRRASAANAKQCAYCEAAIMISRIGALGKFDKAGAQRYVSDYKELLKNEPDSGEALMALAMLFDLGIHDFASQARRSAAGGRPAQSRQRGDKGRRPTARPKQTDEERTRDTSGQAEAAPNTNRDEDGREPPPPRRARTRRGANDDRTNDRGNAGSRPPQSNRGTDTAPPRHNPKRRTNTDEEKESRQSGRERNRNHGAR